MDLRYYGYGYTPTPERTALRSRLERRVSDLKQEFDGRRHNFPVEQTKFGREQRRIEERVITEAKRKYGRDTPAFKAWFGANWYPKELAPREIWQTYVARVESLLEDARSELASAIATWQAEDRDRAADA